MRNLTGALCGACGKSAGFKREMEAFASDKEPVLVGYDQFGFESFEGHPDELHEVTVCNNCGDLNTMYQPWFPKLK